MSGTCKEVSELVNRLQTSESDLRKHSIFFNTSDDDCAFGMMLLISDPDSPDEPAFLRQLHRVLVKRENTFSDDSRRNELEKWLGTEDESLITPLNWLKIAIERYPYRLFVVIDSRQWNMGSSTPSNDTFWEGADQGRIFLRKRVCWVRTEDLDVGSGDLDLNCEDFLHRLRLLWLRHFTRARGNHSSTYDSISVVVDLSGIESQSVKPLDPPDTLPNQWRDDGKREEPRARGRFRIDLKRSDVKEEKWECRKMGLDPETLDPTKDGIVFFRRHNIACGFDRDSEEWSALSEDDFTEEFVKRAITQTAISGVGRTLVLLDSMLTHGDRHRSLLFDVAEQAQARTGIVDERFQEWFTERTEKERSWILAQHATPVFLIGAGEYGQPHMSSEETWLLTSQGERGWDVKRPSSPSVATGLDMLWPSSDHGLDIIIIHQGLLDKCYADDKSRERLSRVILALKDTIPYVVVTSGRGEPDNRPAGSRFFPYSAIEGCIHGAYFEKLVLWRTIGSAR